MKSPIDIIRGRIVDYDPRTSEVTIKAVYPDWPMMVKREYRDCNIQMIDGRPLYELVGEKVAEWGSECMGDEYSCIGAVVGATYPEMGKVLRKIMPKSYILVPGYGAQGGRGKDLVHFFNEDGLGAIVNSSRGIIAAYKQEAYEKFGAENFADASRAAVGDMIADISGALEGK